MPWYVFALIAWNIVVLTIYLVYAAEDRSITLTMGGWLFSLTMTALEMWALIHLALH